MFFQCRFGVKGQSDPRAAGEIAQAGMLGDFGIAKPNDVEPANFLECDVIVDCGRSPITTATYFRKPGFQPIVAMFARPRFGALTGGAQKHEVDNLSTTIFFTRNLVWDAMINLKIT